MNDDDIAGSAEVIIDDNPSSDDAINDDNARSAEAINDGTAEVANEDNGGSDDAINDDTAVSNDVIGEFVAQEETEKLLEQPEQETDVPENPEPEVNIPDEGEEAAQADAEEVIDGVDVNQHEEVGEDGNNETGNEADAEQEPEVGRSRIVTEAEVYAEDVGETEKERLKRMRELEIVERILGLGRTSLEGDRHFRPYRYPVPTIWIFSELICTWLLPRCLKIRQNNFSVDLH